jgi:Flp pilus assembly protein TadG
MASMLARTTASLRRAGLRALGRLGRDQKGATAVEFAFVAMPFFALMFAIIETGLMFFGNQALDSAVADVSRQIRTGQAQQAGMSASAFKAAVCDGVAGLINCDNLKVDVQTYPSFSAITLPTPKIDPATNQPQVTENYPATHGGDIVVVRAYYNWPLFVPGLDSYFGNNGSALMIATAAFRNEPFSW